VRNIIQTGSLVNRSEP